MKKYTVVILAILITLTAVCAAPENIGIIQKQIKIGNLNKSVNVVVADLNSKDLELGVMISNDIIGGVEEFQDMIKRKNAIAAINGNFFKAYDSLEPCATIIQDKSVVYMEGETASMLVTDKRKVNFGKMKITIKGYLNGQRENRWNNAIQSMEFYVFDIWYVNRFPTDSWGVYMYTPKRGEYIKLNNGIAVEVIGDKVNRVIGISYETQLKIPAEGYIVYFGKDIDENFVYQRFIPGRTVELEYEITCNGEKLELGSAGIECMVSAGPYLVKDGKILENNSEFADNKIGKGRAQRSAIGITDKNKLLMVTSADTSINELAQIMQSLGAAEAINLDGGASSALYAKGRLLKAPGRKLSTVLMVFDNYIKE